MLIVLYILVQSRVSCAIVTPTIGVGTRRIRLTCHDESRERRNDSSAGRSGEHLTGSGRLTNESGAYPTPSGKCEKFYNHPNRWGGITTKSGILRSVKHFTTFYALLKHVSYKGDYFTPILRPRAIILRTGARRGHFRCL